MLYFILAQSSLLALIIWLCQNNYRISKLYEKGQIADIEIRGLGLIRGSVRSILALLIVGTYINFAIFGYGMIIEVANEMATGMTNTSNDDSDSGVGSTDAQIDSISRIYELILAALTGIVGSVMGFYFGSGTSSPSSVRSDADGTDSRGTGTQGTANGGTQDGTPQGTANGGTRGGTTTRN